MRSREESARHGFVLLAVLIAMAIALLAAAGAIAVARGALADTRGGARSALARSAALDAVALVSATLAQSRSELLQGGNPTAFPARDGTMLEREHGDERLVVRLVPFADGKFFEAESGKLAVATIDDSTLERLIEAAGVALDAAAFRDQFFSESLDIHDLTKPTPQAWVTRFAAEPMIDGEGAPRMVLADSIDEASVQQLRRMGGDVLLAVARRAAADVEGDAQHFETRVVRALRAEGVALQDWHTALTALTTVDGDRVTGRVSVNHAPVEVLRGLEGVHAELATRIVEERALLTPEERRSAAWLVARGIVSEEEFGPLASRLTARCLQWRFRVEANFELLEPPSEARDAAPHQALARFDCIVDCAQAAPRLALLRDTTMLGAFAAIAEKGLGKDVEKISSGSSEISTEIESASTATADNAPLDFADVIFTKPEFSSRPEAESETMDIPSVASGPVGDPAVGRWVSSGKPRSTEPRTKR